MRLDTASASEGDSFTAFERGLQMTRRRAFFADPRRVLLAACAAVLCVVLPFGAFAQTPPAPKADFGSTRTTERSCPNLGARDRFA